MVVSTWSRYTEFRVGTETNNVPGGELIREDVVVNVGPNAIWHNEAWAFVVSKLGPGWVKRKDLEWLEHANH